MASLHEMQKTYMLVADVQSHDKSQTLGTQMQNIGTQVYEQGRDWGAAWLPLAAELG
jgi:hypothetical protein